MKNVFRTVMFAASLFAAGQTHAQTHQDSTLGHKINKTAKKVGNATATTAKKVGNTTAATAKKVANKTSELAAKGDAAVIDQKMDGKVAPNGETVYINNKAQYYYVNKKGHRVYLKKSQLIDKP
ncbi:hypothetical protein HQ865_22445 [Mucilaginibacter mali]|uniref:PBCV-specific basic adaptor domain-containing protein n=1 Tax=Mucilaginibacter mali TaxID=2740462 RepID=A0A7D4PXE5_9SPHI|nr:hypothetical protein [Mucilaginibacter mali]QKJ32403.1 hypothetical protein HQ865_22445 [Mucilaginibacter mali]